MMTHTPNATSTPNTRRSRARLPTRAGRLKRPRGSRARPSARGPPRPGPSSRSSGLGRRPGGAGRGATVSHTPPRRRPRSSCGSVGSESARRPP
jgi:hypothetical protein